MESTIPAIRIRGARQNNLCGFDVDLPLGRLIVVTGPSGSGKSSFAFDTVYAEGQRRYVETFSPYTRQFLDRMDKPVVDSIEGIPPAIAIEQANNVRTTRSTVGTITEINDHLKLFMARASRAFCPGCKREIRPDTTQSIVSEILRAHPGKTMLVAFGVGVGSDRRKDLAGFLEFLQQQGYLRIWVDGAVHRADEEPRFERLPATVLVIQDRVACAEASQARLSEAVETSVRLGKHRLTLIDPDSGETYPYSIGWHCAHCDIDIRQPTPGLFSFNNPLGACPDCRGFGRVIGIDLDRALPNKSLSIADGVVKAFSGNVAQESQRDLLRACRDREIDIDAPFETLPASDQEFVIYGDRSAGDSTEELWQDGRWYGVQGFFDWLETKTYKMHVRVFLSRYRSYTLCRTCGGTRFQPETLNYKLVSREGAARTLPELSAMPVGELRDFFHSLDLPEGDDSSKLLHDQVANRLGYLLEVGLGYLSLDRPTRTLSGGEVERVNLTTCLGASLTGTLFVMDEPTVGLHARDIQRLTGVMKNLRDKGNTLVVVEHEEAVIRSADHLIDIGPGRGVGGGNLVYGGPAAGIRDAAGSLTADYLYGRKTVKAPETRRKPKRWLEVRGATHHNLRNLDVDLPLGVFCCVTGVSGSGKSTLVRGILYRNLSSGTDAKDDFDPVGHCESLAGLEYLDDVVLVDQSPLSKTPRSTPAVYVGVFDGVRQLFGLSDDAIAAGMTPSTFSFNSGKGRCERCSGLGFEKVEMQFLSDLYLRCPECEGKRYQPHVLDIRIDGKSIHDVLEMSVDEAIPFFEGKQKKRELTGALRILSDVGLGYLKLGQPANVLSGGESQRLKLAGHLATRRGTKALLIFDEPTTGLHFDDVAQLLNVFQRLVDEGNSILVIEHNLEVIKCADWVVDLGPEAGVDGGQVVVAGTPQEMAAEPRSHTGRYLCQHLEAEEERPSARIFEEPAPLPPLVRDGRIDVHGAREHNLKNIDVSIPRDELVVITGLSGSGKSTLAFDLLFAEGQRRFLDSMSPYARQFVEQMEKPDVDAIEGLPPSVAIEQRVTRGGGKSTVATITEVHHFLRLLFAKTGVQHCPDCQVPVEKKTANAIATEVEKLAGKGRVRIFAPLVKARKGFHTDVAEWAGRHGYETLLVDGKIVPVEGFQRLERYKEHSIDVLVGEISRKNRKDALELVRKAARVGKGTARLLDAKNHFTVLSTEMSCPSCDRAFEELDPRLFSFNSPHGWCETCRGFGQVLRGHYRRPGETEVEAELAEERAHETGDPDEAEVCPDCEGVRLNEIARSVWLAGKTIGDFLSASVSETEQILSRIRWKASQEIVARDILAEIRQRLAFMQTVGIDYLTLNRAATTLSGGESQRIRLAAQLGSNLRGVLYVLDEPTIGLHARDNDRLLDALEALSGRGNSVVVVEHDEETMRRASHIIDLGPGAGALGGEVVAQGTMAQILEHRESATARCLREPTPHPSRGSRRSVRDVADWIELEGATLHNVEDADVRIPLHRLSVITGISGSGKSTLMRGILLPAVKRALSKSSARRLTNQSWETIRGADKLDGVLEVDQSPIGKTSRSTPATYVKIFDEIRKQFAMLPASRMRGYEASRFSFNNAGGRCETCQGQGVIKLEMNFLPTTYMPCPDCSGKRYNPPTLEVEYNGRSIADVLDMTIEEAADFFSATPRIARPLGLLAETGLGYLKLGQPSPTLSGGEAQRIKLVTQLARGEMKMNAARIKRGGKSTSTLYLLEEPTIGLHMADVERLVDVLHRLVDEGGTVVVIEHNMDVIAEADYLIDIGPEAGAAGGKVVAKGSPEQVARSKTSRTAPFLREILGR